MIASLLLTTALLAVAVLCIRIVPSFGRLPRGARLQRIEASPNYRDGAFRNLEPTAMMTAPSSRSRSGALLAFLFGKRPEGIRPDSPVAAERTDLHALGRKDDLLVWFGHSSYLLQTAGRRLLIDPVLVEASPLGIGNKPFAGTAIYTPDDIPAIDYLVITHDHWDHLDYRTVTRLRERIGKVICPLGVGEHFERWGFAPEQLVELDWQQQAQLDDSLRVTCLPARHFSGRGLRANRTLWASFLIETPDRRLFIGGDGGYGSHFARIGKRFGPIDLAILENGQYNDDWRYIHTMPEQLARAADDLHALRVMTVHHSKYALARHRWDEPLRNARQLAERSTCAVMMPTIGRAMPLFPGTAAAHDDERHNNQTKR